MKLRKLLLLLLTLLIIGAFVVPASAAPPAPEPLWSVVFAAESLPDDVEQLVERAGATITYAVPQIGVLQVKGSPAAARALATAPGVLGVGPSLPAILPQPRIASIDLAGAHGLNGPGDRFQTFQWDIQRVTSGGASWALEGGTGNHSVVVAVVDTGIFARHPDLAANDLGGRNFVPAGDIGDEPYETGDPDDVTDYHGHGTHLAGAIAANGRVYGVGPNLGIRAYKVPSGSGLGAFEWIAAGAIAAVDDGVDVINFSLGGRLFMGQVFYLDPVTGEQMAAGHPVWAHTIVLRALHYAVNRGVTVVVSAGNDGLNLTRKHDATLYYNQQMKAIGLPFEAVGASFSAPAGMPGLITVSATGPDDQLASYSSYGAGVIMVAAPGGDARRFPSDPDWFLDMNLGTWSPLSRQLPGAGYVYMAGTSMATAKVSGIAGVIIAKEGKIGPQQVIQRIRVSAEDLGQRGTDAQFGWGLSTAYGALSDR